MGKQCVYRCYLSAAASLQTSTTQLSKLPPKPATKSEPYKLVMHVIYEFSPVLARYGFDLQKSQDIFSQTKFCLVPKFFFNFGRTFSGQKFSKNF